MTPNSNVAMCFLGALTPFFTAQVYASLLELYVEQLSYPSMPWALPSRQNKPVLRHCFHDRSKKLHDAVCLWALSHPYMGRSFLDWWTKLAKSYLGESAKALYQTDSPWSLPVLLFFPKNNLALKNKKPKKKKAEKKKRKENVSYRFCFIFIQKR